LGGRIHDEPRPRLRAGQTINIKKPPRYTYRAGKIAVPQATVETTVPLTLSQGGCDIQFTSAFERTLSLTKLEDKIMRGHGPGGQRDRPAGPRPRPHQRFSTRIGTPPARCPPRRPWPSPL
jgi:hypothetical protein